MLLLAQNARSSIVDGTQEFVYLRGGNRHVSAPRNTKALVIGLVIPQRVNVTLKILMHRASIARATARRRLSSWAMSFGPSVLRTNKHAHP